MAAALCDLIGQADRLVRLSVANVRGHDPTQLVAEHVALIEAMQRRDGRTAARIIKAHIAQTEKRALPALKRNAVIVDGREAGTSRPNPPPPMSKSTAISSTAARSSPAAAPCSTSAIPLP